MDDSYTVSLLASFMHPVVVNVQLLRSAVNTAAPLFVAVLLVNVTDTF